MDVDVVVVGAAVVVGADVDVSGGEVVAGAMDVVVAELPPHAAARTAKVRRSEEMRKRLTASECNPLVGLRHTRHPVSYTRSMSEVTQFVATRLSAVADSEKAADMARYMKSSVPFYGVQKPGRERVLRELKVALPPADSGEYVAAVLGLWGQPHREEKYLAIGYAKTFKEFITVDHLDLFERLIREGAWWDLVDDIAIRLVGSVLLAEPDTVGTVMDSWVTDPDMWIRRSAIISQLKHKGSTNEERLFSYCLDRASETEFFIRKAIGWALREYAKTAPDAVARFLVEHGSVWSGLTFREAAKHLGITRP